MSKTVKGILENVPNLKPTPNKVILDCETRLGFTYPDEIRAFYSEAVELFTDTGQIYSCIETCEAALENDLHIYIRDYIVFGADGANEYFAFKKVRVDSCCEIFAIHMSGNGDEAILIANSFVALLGYIVRADIGEPMFGLTMDLRSR